MISKTDANYLARLVAQITPPEVIQLLEKQRAGWGKVNVDKDELEATFDKYCDQYPFNDIKEAIDTFKKDFSLSEENLATLKAIIAGADVISEVKKGDSESAKDFKRAAKKVTSTWRFKKVGKEENKDKSTKKEETLSEKWGTEAKINPKKKGMWKGKSVGQIQKAEKTAKAKGNITKEREAIFALRAKKGWHKKGVTKEEALTNAINAVRTKHRAGLASLQS